MLGLAAPMLISISSESEGSGHSSKKLLGTRPLSVSVCALKIKNHKENSALH